MRTGPQPGVQRLSVRGYRSVRELRLELGRVNVVVGANGSGKTNLYRSLLLLSSAAAGLLARSIAEEGGMPSLLWAGPRKKGPAHLEIAVELEELEYELTCGLPVPASGEDGASAFNLDPVIKTEMVWLHDEGRRHRAIERKDRSAWLRDAEGNRQTFAAVLWPSESVLAQLSEPHRFPIASALRQQLLGWRFYHHFRTDLEAPVRHPQVGIRTPVLAADGRDLAAALQTILEVGDSRGLRDRIARAFPGASLEIHNQDARFSVRLRMPGLQRPLDAPELSDGTLRYLCLLAALMSPRPPPLLALNEPETGLHPELLGPLGELVAQAAARSQIWLTTHSQALAQDIAKRTGGRAIVLEKVQGETRASGDAGDAGEEASEQPEPPDPASQS